jgi:hypothetical protein
MNSMQPHRPTEQNAKRGPITLVCPCLMCVGLLGFGCSRPNSRDSGDGNSQAVSDVPADLPIESTEYEGILYGTNYGAVPTRFWECKSGEVFNMAYQDWEHVWEGSCYGVYQRVRGQLDRHYDPPRLLIEETLEARWSTPADCGFFLEPDYESCATEDYPDSEYPKLPCWPAVPASCPYQTIPHCAPVRFYAAEFAGWKTFDCLDEMENPDAPGQSCEYVGDIDTCADQSRCWNPEGDLTVPGTCMRYCDLNDAADPCIGTGTCVRCSASDRWGLCLPNCSGEECNVDAFC